MKEAGFIRIFFEQRCEGASPAHNGIEELAGILCDAGNYLWERELRDDGLEVLETAKGICESSPDSKGTFSHLC